jgi:uncharacterized repeat protein (TIGR02543 family)
MYFTDTAITLQAVPANGYAFTGWTGACSGTGNCVIKVENDATVGATFAIQNLFDLNGVDLATKTVKARRHNTLLRSRRPSRGRERGWRGRRTIPRE